MRYSPPGAKYGAHFSSIVEIKMISRYFSTDSFSRGKNFLRIDEEKQN